MLVYGPIKGSPFYEVHWGDKYRVILSWQSIVQWLFLSFFPYVRYSCDRIAPYIVIQLNSIQNGLFIYNNNNKNLHDSVVVLQILVLLVAKYNVAFIK